jgi:hypothetical protein
MDHTLLARAALRICAAHHAVGVKTRAEQRSPNYSHLRRGQMIVERAEAKAGELVRHLLVPIVPVSSSRVVSL